MAIYIQGFKKLELSETVTPATFYELGDVYEGGVTTETGDSTTTDFKNELGDIIASTSELGSMSLDFQISNVDATTAQTLLGATPNSNGGWDLPSASAGIERTVAVTSETGNKKFIFSRVKLTPKLTGGFNKETPLLISVKGIVLKPTIDGKPMVSMVDA